MAAPASVINGLVVAGGTSTSQLVQDAADNQVNNSSTGSTGNPSWGDAIPMLFGRTRTVASPLWSGNRTWTGKYPSGGTGRIDYACLIGYAAPRHIGVTVKLILFDGVVVYDINNPVSRAFFGQPLAWRFYDGTQTDPDPLIQQEVTTGGHIDGLVNAPAFTRRMYIMFPGIVVADTGNGGVTDQLQFSTLPEVQIELQQSAASGGVNGELLLEHVLVDLAIIAGYTEDQITCIDCLATIAGCQLNQQVDFKDLLNQLCAAFRIDMLELPNGNIVFHRRINDRTPDYAITPDQMLLASSDDSKNIIQLDRVTTNELPSKLQLSYISTDYQFVVAATTVRRTVYPVPAVTDVSFLALSIPIAMDQYTAQYYAGTAIFDMWAGKTNFQINLPPSFIYIEPGDFVSIVRPSGRVDLCKVTEVTFGADFTLSVYLSSVSKSKAIPYYQSTTDQTQALPDPSTVTPAYGTFTTASPNGTFATVVDLALEPADAGAGDLPLYMISSAPADFYISVAGAPAVKVGTNAVATVMGQAKTTLPAATGYNAAATCYVQLNDTIQVPPADDKVFLIGAPGRWESVTYDTAAAVPGTPGLYLLTGLDRAGRDTASAAARHTGGEAVVFGATDLLRASLPLSDLGQSVTLYAMPLGQAPAPILGVTGSFTIAGTASPPLAPIDVTAYLADNGDLVFTWHRVDPREPTTDFWDDPPQSFAPESYTLQIKWGIYGSAWLTLDTTEPTYTLTAYDRAHNYPLTGFPVVSYTVAQKSATFGLGALTVGNLYVKPRRN